MPTAVHLQFWRGPPTWQPSKTTGRLFATRTHAFLRSPLYNESWKRVGSPARPVCDFFVLSKNRLCRGREKQRPWVLVCQWVSGSVSILFAIMPPRPKSTVLLFSQMFSSVLCAPLSRSKNSETPSLEGFLGGDAFFYMGEGLLSCHALKQFMILIPICTLLVSKIVSNNIFCRYRFKWSWFCEVSC